MRDSDDAARLRHAVAEDLGRLEKAREDVEALLAQVDRVDQRTRKSHLCHVCGTRVREKE